MGLSTVVGLVLCALLMNGLRPLGVNGDCLDTETARLVPVFCFPKFGSTCTALSAIEGTIRMVTTTVGKCKISQDNDLKLLRGKSTCFAVAEDCVGPSTDTDTDKDLLHVLFGLADKKAGVDVVGGGGSSDDHMKKSFY